MAGLQPVEPQLWPSIGPTSALIGCVGDCVLLGSSPLQSRSVIRTVLELENCDRFLSSFAVPSIREKVNGHNVDHFPVRGGYASTVPKVQGQTLKHLTFWPDVPGCPAAGYVALSRVRRDEDYLIGGRVRPSHFRPAM